MRTGPAFRDEVPLLAAAAEGTSPSTQRGRILIVEDEFLVALALEHALLEAGFDVVGVAATAEEALELASSERPDLAVVDIRLAGKRDGIEAAIDLLTLRGVRSIFATAHGDPDTRRRAERAQPIGWLTKPYTTGAVVKMVRGIMAQVRPFKAL
jgi:two-component system, response regulator PdtaR